MSVYTGRKTCPAIRASSNSDDSSDETNSGKQLTLQVKPNVGRSPSPYSSSEKSQNSGSSSNSSAGNRLAQEIHDEFLVCKICLEGYKNPKCLDCLHTFCAQCIETHVNSEPSYKKYSDYREFTCPLCRKRTQLPVGGVRKLPDNFLVSSLTEVVGRQKPSKYPFCDICKLVNRKHREATSKCLDCAKLLCAGCVLLHRNTKVTSGHSLFDVEIEKEIECKEHQDEVIRFYCEPCDACICILCTFNEHKDHEITHFNEAVVKYKANIESLLTTCKEKITKFDSQIETVDKCEDVIKTVEQKVRDKAIEFIQEIRNRERQLLEELQNIFGQECIECIDTKKDLTHQVENLRSACNLTEVILLGKDIELLLLKKDVEDKLNLMNQVDVKNLPPTIGKVVEFIGGHVDFGYLHDHDRPLLSTMPTKRIRRKDRDDPAGTHRYRWTSGGQEQETKPEDGDNRPEEDSTSDEDSELVEIGVQTEGGSILERSTTKTDTPVTEVGVNTTNDEQVTDVGNGGDGDGSGRSVSVDESLDDQSEGGLMARRRRRREERTQISGGGVVANK